MSKKTWILISCLVLSLTLGLGGSLAYLTDTAQRTNTFTMGNVDIEIGETFEPNAQLKPGQTVVKNAWIENTGTNDAWVWMTVAVPSEIADVIVLNWADGVTYDSIVENVRGKDENTYTVYTVRVDQLLEVGKKTGNLLESVTMLGTVDYDVDEKKYYKVVAGDKTEIVYDMSKFEVIVTGYAIQGEGFQTVEAAYEAYNKQWPADGNVNNGLIGGDAENDESGSEEKTFVKMAPVFHSEPTVLTVEAEIDYCAHVTDHTACITTINDCDTVVIVKDGIYRVGNDPDTSVVRTMDNSTVKIMDGHFTCTYPENPDAEKQVAMIHAQGGKIEIYGGTFMELEEPAGATETQADFLKADGGTIVVYGGGFCNWDPTAFVAEGYKVDYFEDNKWYWVSKAE